MLRLYNIEMEATPPIQIDSLKKVYRDGWFRKRVEALGGVSFQVQRGEVFGLLGPNGAGKTTVIKILLGIVRKTAGTASLLGRPAGHRAGRRRVGYLPENLQIPHHHTARTALEYYGHLSRLPSREIRLRRDELLETVGLHDWDRVAVKKYSKGMRQRLGLAQALLHDPELLMLDEPTDGLDPIGRCQVREILHRLKQQGKTIFLNSHLLQEVETVCDHVAILDWGQLRYVGTIDEFTREQRVEEAFEVQLEITGQEEVVRRTVCQWPSAKWDAVAEDRYRVAVRVPDQDAVNRYIDDLRCGGISIVGLTRRRVTLEDAFLNLFQQGQTTP